MQAAFDIPAKSNWYPFGLTGRRNVRRLLPNHVLDLETFVAGRYWPDTDLHALRDGSETGPMVAEIARLLRENVGAVAAQDQVMCNLTAGRDSRMMLAAARDHVDDITFSTFRFPDRTGAGDTEMASRIAARFGLRHSILDCLDPIEADLADWLRDTGTCVAGRTLQLATTSKHVARMARFSLTGLAGELGRSVDWRKADAGETSLSTDMLLKRLGVDVQRLPPSVEAAGDVWRAALGPVPLSLQLDIALVDLWLGSCSGPSFYGHCHGGISISPFNDRRIIDLMLRLPHRYRIEQRLTIDLLDLMWPELNLFPFNPATSGRRARWRDRFRAAYKRLKNAIPRKFDKTILAGRKL
ncbi:hypothetical protein Q9Q95_13115 [Sphingomonas sp. DG1-23]|nr:hypothetical protein [Sphingomonas sp. DG1-23]